MSKEEGNQEGKKNGRGCLVYCHSSSANLTLSLSISGLTTLTILGLTPEPYTSQESGHRYRDMIIQDCPNTWKSCKEYICVQHSHPSPIVNALLKRQRVNCLPQPLRN
ncbi:RNA polymerase sigma factor rpoD [Gossypium australe]|uniref:RNA polymerase sigma factor rpoD n=1 Tax=Gossypium australe TaxID=47621 RepID=A0A5B6VHN6_9ROSI|nr:RNA polymerase sigma factor rpoD [Gossypium australe]